MQTVVGYSGNFFQKEWRSQVFNDEKTMKFNCTQQQSSSSSEVHYHSELHEYPSMKLINKCLGLWSLDFNTNYLLIYHQNRCPNRLDKTTTQQNIRRRKSSDVYRLGLDIAVD
jgi:hypothetical protein